MLVLLGALGLVGCTARIDSLGAGGDGSGMEGDGADPGLRPRPTPPDEVPGEVPLPPATVDGAVPSTAIRGILDCPTAPLPPYTGQLVPARTATVELSNAFRSACRSCHGDLGEGRDGGRYPAIPGDLSFDAYRRVVREGRGLMPAFDDAFVSDDELRADYEALQDGAAVPPPDGAPATGEWGWSEAQVAEAYQRGMASFRVPDKEGVACANCHAPDALDLAVIAYPDDAILRRAGLHVGPEDAANIVDLVHAQRRRFNIGEACDRLWRPLQPGGEVLPGDTPREQDVAFGQELTDRGFKLATGRVETLADAYEVFDEMVATDLRRLPMGIPFPRWTEDGFNGDAHSTINDYLMGVGRVPVDHDAWYALEDRYIRNPSQGNFFEVVHRMKDEMTDQGFGERTEDAHRQANGRCGLVSRKGGGFLSFVDEAKKRSLFIVQHYMRMALLDHEGGWYDQDPTPFADYAHQYGEPLNPFWLVGAQFAEHNCRNAGPLIATFPAEPAEEVPPSDRANGELVQTLIELNHPWQTLAQVYDQSLWMAEELGGTTRGGDNNLHYWADRGFDQDHVHLPFLYLHRILMTEHYWRERRGTAMAPPADLNHQSSAQVHPVLDGERLFFKTANRTALEAGAPAAEVSNAIRCNAYRTILLLQKELFEAGEPGSNVYVSGNQISSLTQHYSDWGIYVRRLESRGGERALTPAFAGHGELCMGGLQDLLDELDRLARGATDLAD
jgi:mono/diheme cytochrome c family protein